MSTECFKAPAPALRRLHHRRPGDAGDAGEDGKRCAAAPAAAAAGGGSWVYDQAAEAALRGYAQARWGLIVIFYGDGDGDGKLVVMMMMMIIIY